LKAAEQNRPDVQAARAQLQAEQPQMDASKLLFLDESHTKTNMSPAYGWGLKTERVVERVPHGHWKTLSVIAALTLAGMRAVETFDGSINGERFLQWVRNQLAPILRQGDTVFMDNLRTHKIRGVREAIEAVGAKVRYLPPYSPDLSPIEPSFNQLKSRIKKEKPREIPALVDTVLKSSKEITPENARGYFRHCGYTRQPTG
jgi:transposase